MQTIDRLLARARQSPKTIVLSEGEDPRCIEAGCQAQRDGIANIVLIGEESAIRQSITNYPTGLVIHNPATSPMRERFADVYWEHRKHKAISREDAQQAVSNPHVYAALLVKTGQADGTIGGAITTTAEIVRTAIQVIGPAQKDTPVSSCFLMLLNNGNQSVRPCIFADCGLIIDPGVEELASIAELSAATFALLVGETPRIAMLSFSTKGSARHKFVTKMEEATAMVCARNPDLLIDGELQFDAAFVPEVAALKAPQSKLQGKANVFIFPDLNAGNLGYKIAQRVGGASALGPILQGFSKPANDLSRGCNVADIVQMIAITSAQAR